MSKRECKTILRKIPYKNPMEIIKIYFVIVSFQVFDGLGELHFDQRKFRRQQTRFNKEYFHDTKDNSSVRDGYERTQDSLRSGSNSIQRQLKREKFGKQILQKIILVRYRF